MHYFNSWKIVFDCNSFSNNLHSSYIVYEKMWNWVSSVRGHWTTLFNLNLMFDPLAYSQIYERMQYTCTCNLFKMTYLNLLETAHKTVANKPPWLYHNCLEQCRKSYQTTCICTCVYQKEVGDGSRVTLSSFMYIYGASHRLRTGWEGRNYLMILQGADMYGMK